MNKLQATLKSALLVTAGFVAGAALFSNVEFAVSSPSAGFSFASGPKTAVAADNANAPIGTLNDFNEAFVRVADSATPSVVTIYTEKTLDRPVFPFGSPFGPVFPMPGIQGGNGMKEVLKGLGSGVIVSQDGYILTNNHVVDDADFVSVRTYDNRRLTATVVGKDPKTDLAVIRVPASGLKPIVIGNSDRLRVGEWVIAIGSPLRETLAHTVTQGIVSAKGRANVGLADYEDFIQTDAAINPGNSGGALVNLRGELVGINTAIASRTGGFDGIGFAVPSNMAYKVFYDLVKGGKVSRGYIGITMQDIDEKIAQGLQARAGEGALVGTVIAGGPAERAGLKTGDVIRMFNGRQISNSAELRGAVASLSPGTTATIRFSRDGVVRDTTVRLESLPETPAADVRDTAPAQKTGLLGFQTAPLDATIAGRLNLSADPSKVVVSAINTSSPAYRTGLRPGDIILSVDRKPVVSPAGFRELVKAKKSGELLFLLVERAGSRIYFAFNL